LAAKAGVFRIGGFRPSTDSRAARSPDASAVCRRDVQ
jgi:hypothetical protein